ncbi:WS/DGAT domain-containing protein [Fodinicola acaciae]|uniref:WS/DGAT domain-containing protein n=1 Tax=Fodinicola acaciae TaxID=2681555 RepID=UPI0013D064FD|nr:WS/DGAT domain-containing protein [Fodinicola acaciae]
MAAATNKHEEVDQIRRPRRVLIISADMGEGHNATGRALEAVARQLWPDITVKWLDALDVMGPGVGPVFRRIYITNVQHTPWLYEFFYDSLWRHRWFANASKRFVGAWCGRRLRRKVADFAPDLILCTYPLGTAGLRWLRERGRLPMPVGAWVSDFAPHPFWVYADIDLNVVMHEVAAPLARRAVPDANVVVGAAPVRADFRPGDRRQARTALDLPQDAFVPVVSCGSLGFGDVEAAARELLTADPRVHPVVVCGRNDGLKRKIDRLAERHPRLRVLGWTDRIAELKVASDVVVTNAGGATGLEAIACGRALLMNRPIAAHGRANAQLMADAGFAMVCRKPGELAAAVRLLLAEPDRLAAMEEAALKHAESGSLSAVADDLRLLMACPSVRPDERLDPQDAMFLHVDTPDVPQQLGTAVVLEPKPDGTPFTAADAADLLAAAPRLAARLRPGGAWRRPRWTYAQKVDLSTIVTELDVSRAGRPVDPELVLESVMDRFFSAGTDGCQAQLVGGLTDNQRILLIKMHHALTDGVAVVNALVARARGRTLPPDSGERAPVGRPGQLARGLWKLARTGTAPKTGWEGPIRSADRHHSLVELPSKQVRQVAKSLGVTSAELLTGLLAEGLHRASPGVDRVRVMVPVSLRTTRTFGSPGNHTGAVRIDLPTGRMPMVRRIMATRAAVRAQMESSAPLAAHFVVRLIGLAPPWLHRWLARGVYRSAWFTLVASIIPGPRAPVRLRGALVRGIYPVLALAPGVRLSVGMLTWSGNVGWCVTSASDIADRGDRLGAAVTAAFAELAAEVSGPPAWMVR